MDSGSDLLEEPVTVSDAAQEVRAARQRLDTYARGYDRIRKGSRPAAITRARVEWSLAVYEWVEATIAQAEAEERRNLSRRDSPPVPSAVPDLPPHDQEASQPAGPRSEATTEEAKAHLDAAHARVQACWQTYTGIRRSLSPAEDIEHARSRWGDALRAWALALAAHAEKLDADSIEERQRQDEQAMQPHPADAFGGPRTAAYRARERVRRQNIERDQRRYEHRRRPT